MKKKIFLLSALIVAAAVGVFSMSAFEAHVINVTAQIENALSVLPEHINFGTVFPEEVLVEPVTVTLSQSFLDEDYASGVDYILKQKPKPRPDIDVFPGEVTGHEYCLDNYPVEFDPVDTYWTYCYPSLCPYLSKHLVDEGEGDVGIPALHDPGITILEGLRKREDITDSWDIDLLVPCFEGQCAQDGVIPPEYQLPPELESQVFGCDLWFEVAGIYRGDAAPPAGICVDNDNDLYGTGDTAYCAYPEKDCDDSNELIYPGATEVCGDAADNDCDGNTDCADADCASDAYCTTIQAGDILIYEVGWMGTNNSTADEWIELRNLKNIAVDLTDWILSDIDGTPNITLNGVIPANGYYLLERTDDTSVPGVTADQIYIGGINNSGEVLNLYDSDSNLIDTANGSPNWPAGDSTTLRTMERCGDLSWHTSLDIEGSPRAVNSDCTRTLNFSDLDADPQYGYVYDYSGTSASFTYNTVGDDTITGTFSATGLKPYATYQLKFDAKPTCAGAGGDDAENELIGLKGRWWNDTDGVNLNSNPATNDTYYYTNSDYYGGSKCIIGYLVWGYVTADSSGNISSESVTTDSSYHVLRCGGSDCGIDTSGADDAKLSHPDVSNPAIWFCGPGDVNGELERFTCGGLALSPANYSLNMILNEESFHAGPGTWTAVMDSPIEFGIY